MNNLKYYNDSLAYDFKMFEPKRKPEEKGKIVSLPQNQKKSAEKRRIYSAAVSKKLGAIFMTIMVLGMICCNIFLRAQISETTAQISKTKKQIESLDSEETRLNVEYERLISYCNLETEAQLLGMKKMDKSQVVYIRVHDKDAARTSDGKLIFAEE